MVVAVAHDAQLGKAMINHAFPRAADVPAAADEVAAGRRAFEARGVDRRAFDAPPAAHVQTHRRLQESSGRSGQEQALGRFLQGGVMGDLAQPQGFDQRRAVGQLRHDAAIVGPQEVLQRQAGEELMLRERLGATGVRVGGKRSPRRRQCGQRHRLRRFTRQCHNCCTQPPWTIV